MALAWNDWYHVLVHTYGAWLRGDPRGWRARNHREHVDGDYKNPPPKGIYDQMHAQSKLLMKREPVRIPPKLRQIVADAIAQKLCKNRIDVVIASMDGRHLHLLARFRDHDPQRWVGIAKKHVSLLLRQEGLRDEPGGIWAKRMHAEPIRDRAHQLNVFRYILAHAKKDAAIWTFNPKDIRAGKRENREK